MAEMKLKRPTKEMMLAVNAAIDGNQKETDKLVMENKLDKKELQQRLENRNGEKYDMTKGRGPRGPRGQGAKAMTDDAVVSLDGRTKLSTLIKLEARVKELLAEKDQKEVKRTRDAMNNVEKIREQLAEAEALLG